MHRDFSNGSGRGPPAIGFLMVCTQGLADISNSGRTALTVADHVCLRQCGLINYKTSAFFSFLMEEAAYRTASRGPILLLSSQITDSKRTVSSTDSFQLEVRLGSCPSFFRRVACL